MGFILNYGIMNLLFIAAVNVISVAKVPSIYFADESGFRWAKCVRGEVL